MRAIWLVIRHDISVILRQRSFWILTLLMPALLLVLNAYYIVGENEPASSGQEGGEQANSPLEQLPALGLVDEAALVTSMPPGIPERLFVHFADREEALAALGRDEVEQVVYIPPDYVTQGTITVYDRNFRILVDGDSTGVAFSGGSDWMLRAILDYNLTGDAQFTALLRQPLPASYHVLHPAEAPAEGEQALAQVVASIVPYVYYFLLLLGSSYLMRSVVAEKENRTAEVLLLSVDPVRLMVGKILAMTGVMLVQLGFWLSGSWWLLERTAQRLRAMSFTFPSGFFFWATLFLVLGYVLFAAVMAAGGALAPNAREGGQMTWLLVIPLMPTLMFGQLFVDQPQHPLTIGLSLFPFSSPSAMVTRLALGEVPLWQLLVSVTLLALTAALFIALAARFFRADNLLSQTPFSWRRLATGWRSARQ